ncbi:HalOD1 output domain-containing protein [Haloprofundus sp. MHR1]|uniref:HalOD1 output domain-containing protein n=1 Tax=Haloprofundus sp. MHR1 TaxID=2572921 RepID=UPI001C2C0AC6|nr:HalOD1 output domain-containing protein [Haloprofundus sp. MHR1]
MTITSPLVTPGPHAKTYHSDDGERPSDTVIRAVADAVRTDPLSLPPLFHAVDPDALDDLLCDPLGGFRSTGSRVVEFHYAGVHVSAFDDGRVLVQSH